MREVETNYGRPDVLVVEYNENKLDKRKREYNGTEFTRIMSYAMTYLCGKSWVREDTLCNYLLCGETEFERIIESLCDLKLVDINKHYIKSKRYSEAMVIKRI